ncbi:hypothetical protein [Halalkalibacillus halophilus]|uniref:hypothetical protein n=1 Tax=Halalkalibacillus halophilus TaxID=392827 RepID=UPI000403DF1A|nr:hypothetical protein [Halalkalibacillus halophilus]
MDINRIKEEIDLNDFIQINTTSRKSEEFKILPQKVIGGKTIHCFLITSEIHLKKILETFDGLVEKFFIDVERKQELNLATLAKKYVKKTNIIYIKTNDLTVESTDILVSNYFKNEIFGKKILIYGYGNIASKVALRLAEKGCNVYITGRNIERIETIIEGLNCILPKYNNTKISRFQNLEIYENTFDALISFVSVDNVITSDYVKLLKNNSISLDGGINNFSDNFISECLKENKYLLRLDVRVASNYLFLSTHKDVKYFFNKVIGRKYLNGLSAVAGGVLGEEGEIVLNNIDNPTQVIGIANGIGGLKDEAEFDQRDKQKVNEAQKWFIN